MKPVNYLPRFLAIVLLIGGVPVFLEIYKTTNDLAISIVLSILYELLVLIGSFLSKVWQRLETKLTEQVAEKIESKIQVEISDYKDRYFEYITDQYRFFDIKGLLTQSPYNLELEEVFVQLGLEPTPMHQIKTSLVQENIESEKLISDKLTIWKYVNSDDIESRNLAILGAPGCGKTTLLKQVALTLASLKHNRNQFTSRSLLPILLFLRDHAEEINSNPNIKLENLIRNQFERRQAPQPPDGWLGKHLENGECLIMLDGLDEIASVEARKNVITWVENCLSAYGKNRFIISSRPQGYRDTPLSNVSVLQVKPFAADQIKQFVSKWYLANESSHSDALSKSNDLLKRIFNTPSLRVLAVNPLLLTMIATVHRYRSTLPDRRVELYSEICDVLLSNLHEARGIKSEFTLVQKQAILQLLAYYLMTNNIREIEVSQIESVIQDELLHINPRLKATNFIHEIENTSGLISEYEANRFGFSHLTFQEYLASVYITENKLENSLYKEITNPWWHETILLYSARTDSSKIISACLQTPNIDSLTLAFECINESREVSPDVRKLYDNVIAKGAEHPNPEIRKLIAEAMLKARLRKH